MKKIILVIISLIFLTGCNGLYNLNNFVLPDNDEFLTLVQELDTPEKICQYMTDNFNTEIHPYIILTPYQLFKNKAGDCDDFSTFAQFVAHYHGYETYQIIISFSNKKYKHSIAVYKENKYSFSDCEIYCSARYNNFSEIIKYDCWLRDEIWTKYIVYDYDMNIVETGYNN
jgi:uncharacterized protein YxeA